MFFIIKSLFKLKKIKKEYKIDYSISFLTPADALNVFSKVKGCKNIISIRNTDSILMKKNILKYITLLSCRKCDHIVSISKQVKDDLIDNFNIDSSKITTIYNPSLNIEFGNSKMLVKNSFFDDFVVINVGRLIEQKGQWHLIRAFSKVVTKYPRAKLIILGQGPLEKFLQNLISDLNLEQNVFLLGFVDNPYDYLKKSDCFVFSSLYEGLGNSILEALACGIPIISTDCLSGPREILAPSSNYKNKTTDTVDFEEYGILVPVGTSEQVDSEVELSVDEILMSKAILELISNDKKLNYYKKMSKKRNEFFNISNIKKEWVDLLEKLN